MEDHFRNRFSYDTNQCLPLLFDPPSNGNNMTDKIVMGGHEHFKNVTGGMVCNNSVQREDGTGAVH